jgi:hypothetical protein
VLVASKAMSHDALRYCIISMSVYYTRATAVRSCDACCYCHAPTICESAATGATATLSPVAVAAYRARVAAEEQEESVTATTVSDSTVTATDDCTDVVSGLAEANRDENVCLTDAQRLQLLRFTNPGVFAGNCKHLNKDGNFKQLNKSSRPRTAPSARRSAFA